jgi:hypothetical protein
MPVVSMPIVDKTFTYAVSIPATSTTAVNIDISQVKLFQLLQNAYINENPAARYSLTAITELVAIKPVVASVVEFPVLYRKYISVFVKDPIGGMVHARTITDNDVYGNTTIGQTGFPVNPITLTWSVSSTTLTMILTPTSYSGIVNYTVKTNIISSPY